MSQPGAKSFPLHAKRAFALLIVVQAAHSLEEYLTALYAVMPPAALVSSLFARDPATGFVIANGLLIAFGLWCLLVPINRANQAALPLAWGWAIVEAVNGLVHIALSVANAGYFPGLLTAPLLLLASGWLMTCLRSRAAAD